MLAGLLEILIPAVRSKICRLCDYVEQLHLFYSFAGILDQLVLLYAVYTSQFKIAKYVVSGKSQVVHRKARLAPSAVASAAISALHCHTTNYLFWYNSSFTGLALLLLNIVVV
jgi:hypothetical protein